MQQQFATRHGNGLAAIMQAMVKLNSLQALHYAVNTGGCEGGVEELKLRMRGEAQLRYMLLAPKDLNNGAKSHPMWVTGGPDG